MSKGSSAGGRSNWPLYSPMQFPEDAFGGRGFIAQDNSNNRQAGTPARMQKQNFKSNNVNKYNESKGGNDHYQKRNNKRQVPTQLAERTPQLDAAQRVEPPSEMRAPRRRASVTRNETMNESFAPQAIRKPLERSKYDISSYGSSGSSGRMSPTQFATSPLQADCSKNASNRRCRSEPNRA